MLAASFAPHSGQNFAGGCRAAGALPGVRARLNRRALLRSLRLLLRAHLEQLRCIDSAALLGHIHAHEAGERAALVFRGVLHGFHLRALTRCAAAMPALRKTAFFCSSLIIASSSSSLT